VKQTVLVLSAQEYRFQDEKDPNKWIEGARVQFVDGQKTGQRNAFGVDVLTASLDRSAMGALKQAPGLFELECSMRPAQKGVSLRVVGARLLKPVDLSAFTQSAGGA
jgi:hypothetical protein